MTTPLLYDLDSEAAILGVLLISPKSVPEILAALPADDFYRPSHRTIYQAIQHLDDGGTKPDPILVADYLAQQGTLEDAGGRVAVHALTSAVPSISGAAAHVALVRRHAIQRRLAGLSDSIHALQAKGTDPKELLAHIATALDELEGHSASDLVHVATAIDAHVKALTDRLAEGRTIQGFPVGLPNLDDLTGGLRPGALLILAARPGMGKTTLALNLALRLAQSTGPVAFFSLEQPNDELALRLLSSESHVPAQAYQAGGLTASQADAINDARTHIARLPLYLSDQTDLTASDIRASSRRLKRKTGLAAVFIDYIQLLDSDRHYDTREREVSETSRRFKLLAKELDCPVIALAQLNRQCESRPNKRPELSDLRESGSLEQDADQVVFIYRDELYHPDSPDMGTAELLLRKNRHGPLGMVRLAFQPNITRFSDIPQTTTSPITRPLKAVKEQV